ncbi:arsenate reductase (azurin) large subunit [Sedimenticola hydrogenitrophicus]|uniref:arsenate reductase (azurin) large subunit n=1 Tax=Sedimenticola hydrogenitrophicus TaxID=2967975 RepID=UPI0023AF742B|nr:arsenate reductase (azurin) large subunit [Sedimenticola hydrogenitrophicus]
MATNEPPVVGSPNETAGVFAQDFVPLPPADAEVLTTACAYCTIACGYKAYRWPVGKKGGEKASENAFGVDFPSYQVMRPWVSPSQHNIVRHQGRPHHIVIVPDHSAKVVNIDGNHSIRGGTLAQKCFNPQTPTRDRLLYPQIRVRGTLMPVSWDLALNVMADISKWVIDKYGEHAWAMKTYSYEFFENTYAITKLVNQSIGTPAYAQHDKPGAMQDAVGLDDAGINSFSASYEDWGECDVAVISGTDPYETKTILFTTWMMGGKTPNKKLIFITPHRTMGVEYGLRNGGVWLPVIPGTDTALHLAIARIIIENGWQDQEFIDRWIMKNWEVSAGYGRGTRNTGVQWRTTWDKFQTDWEEYKQFILVQEESKLDVAAKITGIDTASIRRAAEIMAKPRADGTRPRTSFMLEKGNYWSNNYMNTASLASLALICGSGNRPGRVISRGGGHQRGMMKSDGASGWLSPEKYPGRRKKPINLDRWVIDGQAKFCWVIGTTWIPAMLASQELGDRLHRMTRGNAHHIHRLERQAIVETFKKRILSGGMVLVDSDIYPVEPLNTQLADIVLPAAAWGEHDVARCNSERRLRLYSKLYDAPGEAHPDWWAIKEFALRMGFGEDGSYQWADGNDVFEEAARFGRKGVLNYHPLVTEARRGGRKAHDLLREYGTTGIQTPIRVVNGKLTGTQRLHDPANKIEALESDTVHGKWLYAFDSHNGKAMLLKTPWRFEGWIDFYEAVKPRKEKGEIWVTTGRVNETWQSGFDDLRKPYLNQRWPYPFIFVNPEDARAKDIESGDFVEAYNDTVYVQTGQPVGVLANDLTFTSLMCNGHINTTTGQFTAVAIVSDEMRPGVAMANFNYPGAPANSVAHAVPDPVTNNYRYKLGRAALTKVGESPFKHSFTSMTLKPRPII